MIHRNNKVNYDASNSKRADSQTEFCGAEKIKQNIFFVNFSSAFNENICNTYLCARIKRNVIVMVLTASMMPGIIAEGKAQESVAQQNAPNSLPLNYEAADDGFRKYELSLGLAWRNVGSDDLGKWGAGLTCKLHDGTTSNVYTAGLATHLTFNITRNIGIVSGLELTGYSGKISGNFDETYETVHADGSPFTFGYRLRDYSEQQKLTLLSVPLMVKFTTNSFSDIDAKYFAAFGFKVGIPLAKRAVIDAGSVTTPGLFHTENIVYGNIPEQGFVTNFAAPEQNSKIDFKLEVALTLETGIIFMSNENLSAGAGIYCDIGLNRLLRPGDRYMVEYQKLRPELLRFNSIMLTNRVSSVGLFSLGLKLFVNFNLDKKNK